LLPSFSAEGNEKLKGIACRSVHLGYKAPEAMAYYAEVTVAQSAPGTYFSVVGWDKGYFGIQEKGDGKKVVLFSVWEPGTDSSKAAAAIPEEKRTKLLYKDEKVRVGRFGGEGTGSQSFYDLDWKIGQTYRFLVTSKVNGDRVEYHGYLGLPDDRSWKHLVGFSTLHRNNLRDFYSFVEDFKRDKVSTTKVREAHFGNVWVLPEKGNWQAATRASFTADSNPVMNINAGLDGERFFLATGGDTENKDTKLNAVIELPAREKRTPPEVPAELLPRE
jgi:hypothetical protein